MFAKNDERANSNGRSVGDSISYRGVVSLSAFIPLAALATEAAGTLRKYKKSARILVSTGRVVFKPAAGRLVNSSASSSSSRDRGGFTGLAKRCR